MVYAPLDGTRIDLLIRHHTWWTAHKLNHPDENIWQAVCLGHWIDHNGGGWTWGGMAGEPIGWRPHRQADKPAPRGCHECAYGKVAGCWRCGSR